MKREHVCTDDRPTIRRPWNKGKLTGAETPLRPSHVWSIRAKLQIKDRKTELALFNCAMETEVA
jgi:hypothetical protein